jgi:hypothetical protein
MAPAKTKENIMIPITKERGYERDRIAETVERAIHELVTKEEPDFYEANGSGEVAAALVIAGLRRSSNEGAVVEATGHLRSRSELAGIWKQVKEMASEALAELEEYVPNRQVNGQT